MWTRIRRILARRGPVFEDPQKTRTAGLLHIMLLTLAVTMAVALVPVLAIYGVPGADDPLGQLMLAGMPIVSAASLGLLWLNDRGQVRLAGAGLTAMVWLFLTFAIYNTGGLFSVSMAGYALTIVLAALLLGRRAAGLVAVASLLSAVGLYYAELSGVLVFTRRSPEPLHLISLIVIFGLTAVLVSDAVQAAEQAIQRASLSEQALAEGNRELQAIRTDLEESVNSLQRQSAYLQGSAEIGRAASSILETGELIEQVVYLIRDRFDLYYVGLFLLEEAGDWAVLRAGTGEAGRSMLARGHRIARGEGMIGWCVEQGQARIALDVGADAVRLATAELPSTRSEAALPLRSRGRVLGALTVQSVQPAAFDQAAATVLQTMADQVAVALDNAQLFAESREALEAARTAYGRLTREAWQEATRTQPNLGFRRDKHGLAPAGAAPTEGSPDQRERASDRSESRPQGVPTAGSGRSSRVVGDRPAEGSLTAPIQVRGQVIGVIDAQKESWTAEEAAMLELLADQVGAALEGARLFRDARRHAAHEQAVRHITEQMRRGLEVDEILQTTVAELGRTLGVPRAYVRLGVANDARNRPDQKERTVIGSRPAGSQEPGGDGPDQSR